MNKQERRSFREPAFCFCRCGWPPSTAGSDNFPRSLMINGKYRQEGFGSTYGRTSQASGLAHTEVSSPEGSCSGCQEASGMPRITRHHRELGFWEARACYPLGLPRTSIRLIPRNANPSDTLVHFLGFLCLIWEAPYLHRGPTNGLGWCSNCSEGPFINVTTPLVCHFSAWCLGFSIS